MNHWILKIVLELSQTTSEIIEEKFCRHRKVIPSIYSSNLVYSAGDARWFTLSEPIIRARFVALNMNQLYYSSSYSLHVTFRHRIGAVCSFITIESSSMTSPKHRTENPRVSPKGGRLSCVHGSVGGLASTNGEVLLSNIINTSSPS